MARKVFFSFHYDDVTRVNVVRNSDQITRRYQTSARFHDKSLWERAKTQGSTAIKRLINGGLDGSSVTCVLVGQKTWERPWVRYEILKSLLRGNGILAIRIHDVGFSGEDRLGLLGALMHAQKRENALSSTRREPGLGELLAARTPVRSANHLETYAKEQPPYQNGLGAALLGLEGRGEAPAMTPAPGRNPLDYLGYTIDRATGWVKPWEWGAHARWRQDVRVEPERLGHLPWMSPLADTDRLACVFPIYNWKRDDGYHNFPTWVEAAARKVRR